jgi:hypothetical protein
MRGVSNYTGRRRRLVKRGTGDVIAARSVVGGCKRKTVEGPGVPWRVTSRIPCALRRRHWRGEMLRRRLHVLVFVLGPYRHAAQLHLPLVRRELPQHLCSDTPTHGFIHVHQLDRRQKRHRHEKNEGREGKNCLETMVKLWHSAIHVQIRTGARSAPVQGTTHAQYLRS